MSQTSDHTWELTLSYHRCPACGYILESRIPYQYQLGKWIKNLECTRCHHSFTQIKQARVQFGPFFGQPEPTEMSWE